MSRYIMIRRLRLPAILLLVGGVALLHQTGVIDRFSHWFWPLLLILLGVIMLAERMALATESGYPQGPYPGQPGAGTISPQAATSAPIYPGQPVASAPASVQESGKNPEGGQS